MSDVAGFAVLRPNFGHIEALNDLEKDADRFKHRVEDSDAGEEKEAEAKDVNLIAKGTEPEDAEFRGGRGEIAKMLKEMREEPWQRMEWIDQDVRATLPFR